MSRFPAITLAATTLLLALPAKAGERDIPPAGAGQVPASITRIEGESDKALSIVTVGLSAKPDWSSPVVEDHGTFVQVLMPATVVPEPGTFTDANSPFITKIAAFQVNNQASGQPTDAAIRMFVNRDAAAVKEATVAEILADRLVVTLDHKKLESALARSGTLAAPAAGSVPEVDPGKEPSPAEIVKAATTEETSASASPWPAAGIRVPDLSNKLAIASGFSLFMLILMGVVYRFKRINPFRSGGFTAGIGSHVRQMKKIVKHRVPQSEDGDDYARDISMKTISTMAIGARQKLALVQVGPETILLSVTPGGVQFLTAIGANSRQSGVAHGQVPGISNAVPVGTSHPPTGVEATSLAALPQSRGFEERIAGDTLDEVAQAAKPARSPARTALKVNATRQGASTTKKVRVAVTDDGVTDMSSATGVRAGRPDSVDDAKPSDDITRLIREKLRNLPVI